MTNLDSILKSRDITLPAKVRLVKAMVFPVVMYGCESWTIKKAECRRIYVFEVLCWRRLLRVPWTARRFNQSMRMFIGRTDVEAETPVLWPPDAKSWLIWKNPDAGKDWGQEEKGTTEDEMVGWCWDQLNKQGFRKRDTAREWEMRHKNSEKNEDQGTNTAPRWRCQNWIQARFIILSSMKERIFRELNYNSCGLRGQRTKWSLTTE